MRLTTIGLAAVSLALSLSGTAWAQGVPGGNGSGGNVTGGSTTSSSKSDPGNVPANGNAMKSESGGGRMMKGDAMEKTGGGMKKGGQTAGPAEPTPGR